MLRLILVVALAWAASQFPTYYQNYIFRLDSDLQAAIRSGAPAETLDAMKRQRLDLIYAEPIEWPVALVRAWHTDRALATLGDGYELRAPDNPIEIGYGVAGLFLGFLLFVVLLGPSRGRQRAASPRPAAAQRRNRVPRQQQAQTVTAAAAVSPWSGQAEQPKAQTASRIPSSTGSLKQAAELAKRAAREAATAVRQQQAKGGQRRAGAAAADGRVAVVPPGTPAVQTRHRRDQPIEFARRRPAEAITMSYSRPPLIERRRALAAVGPAIERVTVFRD